MTFASKSPRPLLFRWLVAFAAITLFVGLAVLPHLHEGQNGDSCTICQLQHSSLVEASVEAPAAPVAVHGEGPPAQISVSPKAPTRGSHHIRPPPAV